MARFIKFKNDTAETFHIINIEEISNLRVDWNNANDDFELNVFFNSYEAGDNVMRIRFNGDLDTDDENSDRLKRDNNKFVEALKIALSKGHDKEVTGVTFEAEISGVSLV